MANDDTGQLTEADLETFIERVRRGVSVPHDIASQEWLQEHFPGKDWHRHRRTDGGSDLCDGTPSDCASKVRF